MFVHIFRNSEPSSENVKRTADRGTVDGRGQENAPSAKESEVDSQNEIKFSIDANANQSDANWKPDSDLIEKAKAEFGTTTNPKEAFYILPDGAMLDGSGRHWGGSEREVAGQRQVDHGDISIVIDGKSGAKAMYDWMARSGAMRFDMIVGIASIAREPTQQQLSRLASALRGKYLALSRNTPEGRIVDDTEFERASAPKIADFFSQAQEKYAQGVVGPWASKINQKNIDSSGKDGVKKELTDAFGEDLVSNLEDSGLVEIVETEEDLPKSISAKIQESLSPMKSIEANIKRGKKSLEKALIEKTSVHRAMFRAGLGWVDFIWGDEGGKIKQNGSRKGEKGVAHIIEARQRKDGLSRREVGELLNEIVIVIAKGKEINRHIVGKTRV